MATDTTIRRDVPIPYYFQLMQLLQSQVESGVWVVDAPIPSENELCAAYKVSRTVVRQALGELAAKGVLYRVKGKGTFVAPRKLQEKFIQRADGFYHDMTSRGFTVTSSVTEQCTVDPSPNIRQALALPERALTIKIDRVRFVDGEPMQFVTTYIPYDLCPDLLTSDLSSGSLYELLREHYGLAVASGTRYLEAVTARRPVTTLLGVSKGTPLFKMESISYLSDGRPLEYYEAWHRGDRSKFEIELVMSVGNAAVEPPPKQSAGLVGTAWGYSDDNGNAARKDGHQVNELSQNGIRRR